METIHEIKIVAKADKEFDEIESKRPEDEKTFLEKNVVGKFKYEDQGTKKGTSVSGN